MTKRTDAEIKVLRRIVRAMMTLDSDTQERVAQYVYSRWAYKPPKFIVRGKEASDG